MYKNFKVEDNKPEPALVPLDLNRYAELFCCGEHSKILDYYQHFFAIMDKSIYQPYFILGAKSKTVSFKLAPGESIVIDLSDEIDNGQIIYFETDTRYSEETTKTELILKHGNSPFHHYLISPCFCFYCYPRGEVHKSQSIPYELHILFFTKDQYSDFALRQLSNAIYSMQTENFVDCVLKTQIACENLLRRNLPKRLREEVTYKELINRLKDKYEKLPIFPYIEELHEKRRVRNDILHFKREHIFTEEVCTNYIHISTLLYYFMKIENGVSK